jgi:hypothetical protein
MKPQSTQSPVSSDSSTTSTRNHLEPRGPNRCRAHSRSGTRCHASADPDIGFCHRHAARHSGAPRDTDLSSHVSGKLEEFRSATQINEFLTVLIRLVITNEISARRAAVIGYLTSQLRHTLPAIAAEQAPPEPEFIIDLPRPGGHSTADSEAGDDPAADHADPAVDPNDSPATDSDVAPVESTPEPVLVGAPPSAPASSVAGARHVYPEPQRAVPVRPPVTEPTPPQPPSQHQRGFGSPHLSGPPPNLDKLFPVTDFSVPRPRRKKLRASPHGWPDSFD